MKKDSIAKRKTKIGKKQKPAVKNTNNEIHVALLYGGVSAERDVSLMSFEMLNKTLLKLGYVVTPVDVGHDIIKSVTKVQPDVVFNGLYGTYGEDGYIPALLDMLGIKYTHSGVVASAIGFNKILAYKIFEIYGIKTADRKIISKKLNIKNDPMSRPYVIKPISEGSSVGVHLVFDKDNFNFANYKWEYGNDIIVEKYIPGKELAVAVFDKKAIGIIDIVPVHENFHSFDSKYKPGCAKHVMPAKLDQDIENHILEFAEKAHEILGCKTISRVDFRYNPKEHKEGVYVLEINTHPGMTPLSAFPEICAYYGITKADILDRLVKDALYN